MRRIPLRKVQRAAMITAPAFVVIIVLVFAAAAGRPAAPLSRLATAAAATIPSDDFSRLLQDDGVTQAQLNSVESLLGGVHCSIKNKTMPNSAIAEAALYHVNAKHPGQTVTVSDLAQAIATYAFQVELFVAGSARGLTPSDSEMSAIANRQEALYNQSPDSRVLPQGETADEFFHSATYRTAYLQALVASRMKDLITGKRAGSAASTALRDWAAAAFLPDVVITGLGGVTASNLANFL